MKTPENSCQGSDLPLSECNKKGASGTLPPAASNILIVDDMPINLKLLTELLVHQGYKVRPVLNGSQALDSVNAKEPDLILLDIRMPGMSGYEVCNALKQSPETRDIPIIFISAMDDIADKIKAFKAGGVDYITKPFQAEEVLARVKTHLEMHRLQLSLQEKNDRLKREISERKATERKLRESEQRLRQAHAIGRIGSWEYDLATKLAWGSKEACRILALGAEDRFFSVADVEKRIEEKGCFQSALSRLTDYHEEFNIEFKFSPDHDAPSRSIVAKAELVKDDPDTPPKVVGVVQDVTEQKNLEMMLRQMHKMESIGTLAGGVAHDINNILSIILGNTELAIATIPQETNGYDNLMEVVAACTRAKDVILKLLNFCRRSPHPPQYAFPEKLLSEVIKLIQVSIPEQIHMALTIEENLSPILIDPDRFDQVVMNICSNAVHAMPEQGGRIDIRLDSARIKEKLLVSTGLLEPGDYVRLTVKDTGAGMTPEIIERIFDPYFTTRDFGKGTGMGLAIVHGIVTDASGGILVESRPEKGSRIIVFFPAAQL